MPAIWTLTARADCSHPAWVAAGPGTPRVEVVEADPRTGTFGTPSVIPSTAGQGNDDKPFIVADRNPASPFVDTIYAVLDRFNVTPGEWEVFFARSTDHGQTWTNLQPLSHFYGPNGIPGDSDDEGFCGWADVAVAPNEDVYVSYHSQPEMNNRKLEVNGLRMNPDGISGKTIVRRSVDGGVHFGPVVEAFPAGTSDVTFNTQDALNGGNLPGTQFWTPGSSTPYVLADPTRPGNVYIVTNDDPDNVHGSGDDADVVIARSTDNGQTWTRSTVIAGPSNSFQIFPFTAIDRFGNIVLSWLDNRRGFTNSSGRFLMDFMATYSTDGGITWAPEFRLSDIPFDPDPDAVIRFAGPPPTTQIGAYFGIDVYGHTAHVIMDSNFFSGPDPAGPALTYTSFALAGSLTVTGDNGADVISIDPLPGNPNFIEIVVNGERQYVGRFAGLSGISIDAGGGTDSINISNTGASLPITILPSAGDDVVNINAAGTGFANVVFSNTQRLGALTIGSDGFATLPAGGSKVLTVTSLMMTGNAKLDLSDGDMLLNYAGASQLAAVQAMINSARNGGTWDGGGITSTNARDNAQHNATLGAMEAADYTNATGLTTFSGEPIDATAVLVKFTYYGDTDFNGRVNFDDYVRTDTGFNNHRGGWLNGDFDGNGIVNFDDYVLIDLAFNTQGQVL
jgi:hypothetical protein